METSSTTPEKIRNAIIALKIEGWFVVIIGIIVVLIGLIGSGLSLGSGDGGFIGAGIFGLAFTFIALIVAGIYGVIPLVAAHLIEQRKDSGKILGIILGALSLLSFPIGTIIGIFVLYGLLSTEAEGWFKK